MKQLDDRPLLSRIRDRDPRALEELITRHSGRLAATCRHVLGPFGHGEDVEEVLGDVFFHVWTAAAEYDAVRGDVAAWLRWLTISRGLTRRRSIVRRLKKIETSIDPAALDLPDERERADEQIVAKEEILAKKELLLDAIQSLRRESSDDADIVHRRYILRQKPLEIAQSLGIDANRTRVRLFRGVKKIRRILSKMESIA